MTQPGWYPTSQGHRYWNGQQWAPQPATVVVQGPNHALHAILTVCSCGLWAPVWIIVTIAGSKVKVTR